MTENTLENLLGKIRGYNPDYNSDLIVKAYNFALTQHVSEKRLSGESLISHLLNVAHLAADIQLDDVSVIAALLHESLRKDASKLLLLEKEFGSEIAKFVSILSELSKIPFVLNDEKLSDNVRKVFLLLAKDIRVVLVRLADRVENARTAYALLPTDQAWIGKQSLYFYAPLAEMLGVRYFQRLLEDGGFAILHPEIYKQIISQMQFDQEEMGRAIEEIRRRLLRGMAEEKLYVKNIFGRGKHVFSIYKKLLRYQKEGKVKDLVTRRIYDQMALMIITKEVDECYRVLSLINRVFEVVPEEFDDYIAKPKPNGYRALHTIIKDEKKRIFEIQIKTEEMHLENEFGKAAHVYYKSQEQRFASPAEKGELDWVVRLSNWSSANVKEIFSDKIFVFSPKKDVYELPEGATSIDFAYAVHTKLAEQASGALIDGKLCPLNQELKNGQTIEIITDKNRKGPSPKWLDFAVTEVARRELSKQVKRK